MFSGSASGFAPLLSRRHWRRFDDGRVTRRRPIHPPVGLLLTVRHNLLPFLSIFGDFQLEKKLENCFIKVQFCWKNKPIWAMHFMKVPFFQENQSNCVAAL
jgi:hypothetical protein